jgi:hypothetical protein
MSVGNTPDHRRQTGTPSAAPGGAAVVLLGECTVRIATSIGWHRPWLRKVIAFACHELDYPVSCIAAASFSQCHNATHRGKAYPESRIIRAKINPLNVYPIEEKPQKGLPELALADAMETLIELTAHEIAHLERWHRTVRRQWASGKPRHLLRARHRVSCENGSPKLSGATFRPARQLGRIRPWSRAACRCPPPDVPQLRVRLGVRSSAR